MQNQKINNRSYFSVWLIVFIIFWLLACALLLDQPIATFKSNWLFVIIGFFGAILGNISAVGGGIIFIPAMMFIFHLPPVIALKVAILSQCFGMTSGALTWIKKEIIPREIFYLTIPAMLIGSSISSFLIHPSPLLVKLFFGPVSILLGVFTLYSIYKKKSDDKKYFLDTKSKIYLALVSLFGGLITGWVAIGEGEVVAAYLMVSKGISATLSVAVGVVLLSVNSLFLGIVHQFHLGGLPFDIGLFTGLGCVFGARLAPFLATKINPKTLKLIFAAIAISDGALFVMQFLLK